LVEKVSKFVEKESIATNEGRKERIEDTNLILYTS
jgi:hypothetical protein